MAETITREELEELLPHREPFLLIDGAEGFESESALTGLATLEPGDPHFAGHFPDKPVMPGVLLVEGMAQTGAALVAKSGAIDVTAERLMLTIVHSARFRAPVVPPCLLRLIVRLMSVRHGLYRYEGRALVDDRLVAEAAFSAKRVAWAA